MFETLFKMIPWGSIIMEGVNGLCEIVDNIFGNNPSRNYNNTYYTGLPQQYVQPQINNTQNYYSNNTTQYNKSNMVYYNEEGKQMIQGVYFID